MKAIDKRHIISEGDYVRKPISDNYGIGFYHDDDNPLSICIYHREDAQFSPHQKKTINEALARPEFTDYYSESFEGESTDGKSEILVVLKINVFNGWENADIADRVVKLFEHFITAVNLLDLT